MSLSAHTVQGEMIEENIVGQESSSPVEEVHPTPSVIETPPFALERDVWIYRIVVVTLGLTVLVSIGGVIFLATVASSGTSEAIVAIGSAAVGALAGLLAPAPRGR